MTDKSWISVHNSMPALNRLVEIKDMDDGQKFAEFKASKGDFNILYFLVDEDTLTDFSRVTHWRYPVEKKPDFGNIKKGDVLIIESSDILEHPDNVDKYKYVGFLARMDPDDLFISSEEDEDMGEEIRKIDIYKITRINLEEKTFEEI